VKILLISWKLKISTTLCSSFDRFVFVGFIWVKLPFNSFKNNFWKYFEFHKNHLWRNYSSYRDCRKNKLISKESSNTFLKTGFLRISIICIVFTQLIFKKFWRKSLKRVGKNNSRTANRIQFPTIFLEIKLQTLWHIWIVGLWRCYFCAVLAPEICFAFR
jgi:hypothetical protein